MDEPHAVVERQPVGDLPVVLDVGLVVGVDVLALDEPRRLRVGAEDAERGIGVAEAGVERVVGVVAEVQRAERVALVLPLGGVCL